MSDPVSVAQAISALLQAEWALAALPASSITWATSRYETAQDLPSPYVISCYNPAGPVTSELILSQPDVWQFLEDVEIDILIQVSAGSAAAISLRESVKQQVYSILQANYNSVPNFSGDIFPLREREKLESPQLARLTIFVRCRSFLVA